MSKVLNWENLGAVNGKRNLMKEKFNEINKSLEKVKLEESKLEKMIPIMKNLFIIKLAQRTPIKITKSFTYTTESLGGQEEEEDDFYHVRKSEKAVPKFETIRKTVRPGTELTFLNLEKSMNQIWFKTSDGKELGIYLEEQNNLMKCSEIYDVVLDYLNNEGETINE